MTTLITGFILALILFTFYRQLQIKQLTLKWYQWLSVAGCLVLAAFTVLLIESFIAEGAPHAALIMGSIFAILTLIWGILIVRLFIVKPVKRNQL